MVYTVEFNHKSHIRRAYVSSTLAVDDTASGRAGAGSYFRVSLIVRLRMALESEHNGKAAFVQSLPASVELSSGQIWNGIIYIFSLSGSSFAKRAYCWLELLPSGSQRIITVLHIPPVLGPQDAVELAMVRCHDQLR